MKKRVSTQTKAPVFKVEFNIRLKRVTVSASRFRVVSRSENQKEMGSKIYLSETGIVLVWDKTGTNPDRSHS